MLSSGHLRGRDTISLLKLPTGTIKEKYREANLKVSNIKCYYENMSKCINEELTDMDESSKSSIYLKLPFLCS